MAVIRWILLVTILAVLTLLLVQNWSPVLSLVFLGVRSQPLPLAVWVLLSSAAGAFTSLLVTFAWKLSNYQGKTKVSFFRSPLRTSSRPQPESKPKTHSSPGRFETEEPKINNFDDWETEGNNQDWDFEEKRPQTPVAQSPSYERPQTPKTVSQSGSVYSYGYRDPKNTGVGKTESVYDADYRVIIPPYQSQTTDTEEDDDWGFFEDEDFQADDRGRK